MWDKGLSTPIRFLPVLENGDPFIQFDLPSTRNKTVKNKKEDNGKLWRIGKSHSVERSVYDSFRGFKPFVDSENGLKRTRVEGKRFKTRFPKSLFLNWWT